MKKYLGSIIKNYDVHKIGHNFINQVKYTLSLQHQNKISRLVIIAPITSKIKQLFPFEVKVNIQKKEGKIMLDQIRSVDKARLSGKLSSIGIETMFDIEKALKIVFALT